jgi:acyl-CoA oxidase
MIAPLVLGRLHIATLANRNAFIGLKIAIRYSHQRRQFKPQGATEEIPIINYLTHQRRLYPPLSASFAYHFALKLWREKFLKENKTPNEERDIHLLASGLKRSISSSSSHPTFSFITIQNSLL